MANDLAVAARLYYDHPDRFGSVSVALEVWESGHIDQEAYLARHPELEFLEIPEDIEEGIEIAAFFIK